MRKILIIFGATGDLMDRKIAPALYGLFEQSPECFDQIVGFGRRSLDDASFGASIKESVSKKLDVDEVTFTSFLKSVSYHCGEFHDLNSFIKLKEKFDAQGKDYKLYIYLATPPNLYELVIPHLTSSGLVTETSSLMIEKPIGNDTPSALKLEKLFAQHFKENQLYRIDHYLGKDIVQNILHLRFTNSYFEPLLNNNFVNRIEIFAHETLGVEMRGNFYDKVGAFRDFEQNHLLQIMALLTMEQPECLDCGEIRTTRAQLLQDLKLLDDKTIASDTFRAQYNGYREITDVNDTSETETYFRVKCFVESSRWNNVPFILESGKRLGDVHKEVIVYFKNNNKLSITIEPEERITLSLNIKNPGITNDVSEYDLALDYYHEKTNMQYVGAYIRLLHDFSVNDQTFFVSQDELLAMWRFTDPIISGWKRNLVPLHFYNPDIFNIEAAKHVD